MMGVRTTAPWEPACEALQARPKNTGAVGTVLTPEAGPGTAFHFLDGPHHRVANPSGKPLSGLGDASLHGHPFLMRLLSRRSCSPPPAQEQPPLRQAGRTHGCHAFGFLGPRAGTSGLSEGHSRGHLYPEKLPRLAAQSNKQPPWMWGSPGPCPLPMGDHLWPCS